jgi:sulfite exporter TauE/SafE
MDFAFASLDFTTLAAGALFPVAVGLGSSFTHCAGMCGPIHILLSSCAGSASFKAIWPYHAGRILGYGFLGLVVGLVGQSVASLPSQPLRLAIGTAFAVIYAVFGLGLMGWTTFGAALERKLGSLFPSRWFGALAASGAGRKALFPAGLAASLLPCPGTHAVLLYGIGLGQAWKSAGAMLLLGVSTLPVFAMLPLGAKAVPGWIRIRYRGLLGMAFLGLSAWRIASLALAATAAVPTASCH